MSNILRSLKKRSFCFSKKPPGKDYFTEIFSTSDNKINVHNTSPLEIDDNIDKNMFTKHTYSYKAPNYLINKDSYKYTEYKSEKDYTKVKSELRKLIKSLKFQSIGLSILLLLYLSTIIITSYSSVLLSFINVPITQLYTYISCMLYLLSVLIGFSTLKDGFLSLIKLKFTPSCAIFLSCIALLTHCTTLVVHNSNSSAFYESYVGLFIFEFLIVVFNYLLIKLRIIRNLKFVSSKKQKYQIDSYNLSCITTATNKNFLNVAYQAKSNFLQSFIASSNSFSFSDSIFTKIIPFTITFSIFIFAFSFINSFNVIYGTTSLVVSLLICTPFSFPFCVNFFVNSLCKKSLKSGSMIVGENCIKNISKMNSIILNECSLYPADNVVLRGIKTFNGQRIDEAILSAAAVVCAIDGPLCRVFDKIILGKRTILTKASDIEYQDNLGAVGWVNGQRILVGNRDLLKKYRISPPSRDYEKKYRNNNRELTYFAVGKRLVAMFILEYIPNLKFLNYLKLLEKNNIKLLIRNVDCNISKYKISLDFNISEEIVEILPFEENLNSRLIENKIYSRTFASIASFGNIKSLIKSLCLCRNANIKINMSIFFQVVCILLSLSITCILFPYFGLNQLKEAELILYNVLWTFISLIIPKLKKI